MRNIGFTVRKRILAIAAIVIVGNVATIEQAFSQRMYGTLAGINEEKAGMIYSFDVNDNPVELTEEYVFDESGKFGKSPNNSLTFYKGVYYGVTQYGGDEFNSGVLFTLRPSEEAGGASFEYQFEFTPEDGSIVPVSPLTYHEGFLYGIAGGGENLPPTLYRVNPDDPKETFETVASFSQSSSTSNNNGISLISFNGNLYGVLKDAGSIFKYNPKDELDVFLSLFSYEIGNPGPISLRNNLIYGTFNDGQGQQGVFFFNPSDDNPELNIKFNTQSSNLQLPNSGLAVFDQKLFSPVKPVDNQTSNQLGISDVNTDAGNSLLNEPQFKDAISLQPRSKMTLVNGKYFVGTTSQGDSPGAVYVYSIDEQRFLEPSSVEELQQGAPQFSNPQVALPVTVWRDQKWSDGKPDDRMIAIIEDSLYITEGLLCHDLYVEQGAEMVIVGGTVEVLNNAHNFGTIEVLNCESPGLKVLGSHYGLPQRTVNAQYSPSATQNTTAYLGEPFNLQLSATYLPNPFWGPAEISEMPPGLTLDSDGSGVISGEPTEQGNYTFNVQIQDNVAGCNLSEDFRINVRHKTTWSAASWSNGDPLPDGSSEVVIDGAYFADPSGGFVAQKLTINNGRSLYVNNKSSITTNQLANYGNVFVQCTASLIYQTVPANDPNLRDTVVKKPILSPNPDNTINLKLEDSAEVVFSISNIKIGWNWSNGQNFVPGMSFDTIYNGNESKFVMSGTPTISGTYNLNITAFETATNNFCSAEGTYRIEVIEGIDPNLRTRDIRATFGDKGIKATATTDNDEVPYFFSMEENPCAEINQNTGKIIINCASVSEVEFYVTQDADESFKSGSATGTLFIDKATPTLMTGNSAFILQDGTDSIPYTTNSDGIPSFQQFSDGGTDVATVSSDGYVELLSAGTFTVFITLPETDNYNSKNLKKTFTVVNEAIPPIGTPDTLILVVGATDTINILDNDLGGTGTIQPELTDIDLENKGIQSKFFSPSMGTFTIDAEGNLIYNAFEAFLGTGTIYYTISDETGAKSAPIEIYVEVVIPTEAPELIATELITPNDDDLNDAFVIGNVDLDKPNYLRVYDRYGNEVYYKDNYRNDWQGDLDNGDALDDGTYFFIFKEEDRDSLRGTFQIKRQK